MRLFFSLFQTAESGLGEHLGGQSSAGDLEGCMRKWSSRIAMIQTKRVYDPPAAADGLRILIDRLWPRGLTKEEAAIDEWMKDVAPSTELRRWFAHDPEKWREFQRRYRAELKEKSDLIRDITDRAASRNVTLVYGARDEVHNDAAVLASIVRARLARRARAAAPRAKRTEKRARRTHR